MSLPELEREDILAGRLEEMQKYLDRKNLQELLRAQRGDNDNVSKAAKRQSLQCCLFKVCLDLCLQVNTRAAAKRRRKLKSWTS